MEYIKVNGTDYECLSVSTQHDCICFSMEGDVSEIANTFASVSELSVSDGTNVYGVYSGLTFSYAQVNSEGIVTVCMSIKSNTETRLTALEETVDVLVLSTLGE